MIFSTGDRARYEGPSTIHAAAVICPGDIVTVETPNEDEDADVYVRFDRSLIAVSPQDLVWLEAGWPSCAKSASDEA